MKSIKICHFSDFHFGSENSKFNIDINQEMLNTLIKIVEISNLENADIMLIPGDLFESTLISDNIVYMVNYALSEFKGDVFISPGNHDYFCLNSPYTKKWAENIHIFTKEEMDFFEIKNVRIYGFAFNKSHITKFHFENIDLDKNYINIASIHADLSQNSNYNPVSISHIEKSGFDYVAMGHIHKRTDVLRAGDTFYAYSGNPYPRGFDEMGEKGFYIGNVYKKFCDLKFISLNNRQYIRIDFDIKNFGSIEDIAISFRKFLNEKYGKNYSNYIYEINLVGNISFDIYLEYLNLKFFDISYIKFFDKTKKFLDYKKISLENSVRGVFVRNILKKMDNDKNFYKDVLDAGLSSFGENYEN